MDMQRIDIHQPGELARWAAQLAVPPEALADAVRMVGTDVDKVQGYLASVEAEQAREPGHGRPSS